MLRKALTLGMVFIFALSLLLVSMITCFTYDAEAHDRWYCYNATGCWYILDDPLDEEGWTCVPHTHNH